MTSMSAVSPPALAQALPTPWGDDDETLRCVAVRQETADVRTFVLRSDSPRSHRYRPGQFITLALDIGGEPVRRCYTLSSTPTRPDALSITVKRVPGGVVSNWLHDHLQPGMVLNVAGPAGAFTAFDADGRLASTAPLLMLSGGSGITPLMSMARALHDLAIDADVQFVHAARTPSDVIFAEELALMARNQPRFRHSVVCEQRGSSAMYAGALGRLSLPLLQALVPDLLSRDVYCCGPAPFMAAVRALLQAVGYDMARYREESFSFESAAPADAAADVATPADASTTVAHFAVHLKKRGDQFECAAGQTVLQAATAAGLRLPFSCSNGVCGTCRTHKLSGEVDMKQNGGLRPREVAQGWFLPCCSTPLTDLVLDR
ncbi:MAG: hypothetical protein RJA98_1963 [Pseudomonadota bacterium]